MPATWSAICSRSRRAQRVLESKFKGLSDIALSEAKRLGCSYADVRFTRNVSDASACATAS